MPERPTRTSAAILFTDIAGYTARMEQDESGTLLLLEQLRRSLSGLLETQRGQLIKDLGDGQLCLFQTPEDAIACAVALQRGARTLDLPLRAGIHAGEITWQGQDVYGSAVNLASRIESFAAPGSVLVSDAVYHAEKGNPDVAFQPLGKYYLKNIEEAVDLYAVVDDGLVIPDPKELSGKGRPFFADTNLPRPLTSFLGREREIEEIRELLRENRLLTLTGPGGTGKTRLALRVAEEVRDQFRDGLCWVELTPVSDPEQAPFAIAQALGLSQETSREIRETLVRHLYPRQQLLLLDNFEQVVVAAPLVKDLLEECPELKVLVTSRIVLELPGEQEYPVEPLPLPAQTDALSIDQLRAAPSIALFEQRARAVKPDFQLDAGNAATVAQICTRLDGLPLAIELAAARIKLFPPKILGEKLSQSLDLLKTSHRGVPPRHQTLRQTIAWSHALLAPEEQQLFQRFSVFVGGGTLEAVEAVCGRNGLAGWDVVDGLSALVNKSLVRPVETEDAPRYYMLETIREFARESLEQSVQQQVTREAHAAFFLQLAERAQPHLTGAGQQGWLSALKREQANLQAAIEWCLSAGKEEWAYRFGAALWRFWVSGNLIEGERTVKRILQMPVSDIHLPLRLNLLGALGGLYLNMTNMKKAALVFEEILQGWNALGKAAEAATAKNNLGYALICLGEGERGKFLTLEALKQHEEQGNLRGQCLSWNNLGILHLFTWGRPKEAIPFLEKALSLRIAIGDERGSGYGKTVLGRCFFDSGRNEEGMLYLKEGEAIHRSRNDQILISNSLVNEAVFRIYQHDFRSLIPLLAELEKSDAASSSPSFSFSFFHLLKGIYQAENDLRTADECIRRAMEIREDGLIFIFILLWFFRGYIWLKWKKLAEGLSHLQKALRLCTQSDNWLWTAACLELIAVIFTEQEHFTEAARLLGKADAMREAIGAPMPPLIREYAEPAREMLAARLGEVVFREAFETGRGLDLEEAAGLAEA